MRYFHSFYFLWYFFWVFISCMYSEGFFQSHVWQEGLILSKFNINIFDATTSLSKLYLEVVNEQSGKGLYIYVRQEC